MCNVFDEPFAETNATSLLRLRIIFPGNPPGAALLFVVVAESPHVFWPILLPCHTFPLPSIAAKPENDAAVCRLVSGFSSL